MLVRWRTTRAIVIACLVRARNQSDIPDECRSEQKPKDGGKKQPVNQAGYEPLL
jgi:hypothetical protein